MPSHRDLKGPKYFPHHLPEPSKKVNYHLQKISAKSLDRSDKERNPQFDHHQPHVK